MTEIKAVFFDQDGVIVDTERDGHRVAFNETFQAFDIDLNWSEEYYHALLQVGGGKERMRHDFKKRSLFNGISDEKLDEKIKTLHQHKTGIFSEKIASGALPLRPGVHRLMKQINEAGLILGICTTSNQKIAETIIETLLSDIQFNFVLAGDCVQKKKPDPEIYQFAIEKAGIKPGEGWVVEDSHIGVTAATKAGLHVIATTNGYTKDEDVFSASIVTNTLGDESNSIEVTKGAKPIQPFFNLSDLTS